MQDKVNLLRRDEFGALVVMRAVADLIRAACLPVAGPVEVRMEDARFPEWDDLTVTFAVDGGRRIESWQVKHQTTPFSQEMFVKLLCSLRTHPEIAAWHLLLRDLVDVGEVGNLRILRALCERLSRRGLDPEVLPTTLDSKTRQWLEFVKQSLGSTEEEALRFLSRLEIETVISERDLKDRVLEKLGTVYQDPETAYARLREYLRENLDSAGRITWELVERCAEAGRRLTPTQKLLRSELEPLEPDPRPGDLLRAGSRVLSFHGRTEQLQEFERWLQSTPPVSVMLFTGAGGTGKTRLLIEWCLSLRMRGEVAGFLPRNLDANQLRQLAHARERRVVAVDYAETRTGVLRELLELAVEDPQARGSLRLVLLARREGEWWNNLGQQSLPVKRVIERQGRVWDLGALASDVTLRRQLFDEALDRFADLRKLPKPARADVELSAAHFAHPLYLQMAALATLEGRTAFQAVELLKSTLEHEERYWALAMNALGHSPPERRIVERGFYGMMTLATLWGGLRTRELASARLSKLTGVPAARTDLIETILDLLEKLYGGPRAADGTWVRGLEPDLLGEYFVAEQLQKKEEILGTAFDTADDEECRSALIVLTRLADRQPQRMQWIQSVLSERLARLGEIAVQVAAEVGAPLGIVLALVAQSVRDTELLARLLNLSRHSAALLEFRMVVLNRFVSSGKPSYSQLSAEEKESFAKLVADFASSLREHGQYQSALEQCEYALSIYRELSPSNDEKFGDIVPQLLSFLGTILRALNRTAEGLKASAEACSLARKLFTTDPEQFGSLLGRCLNNYAVHLNDLGRHDEALQTIQESVAIRRRVLATSPNSESAASELAFSLSTQSSVLAAKGRIPEALPINTEAVELTQALADKNPNEFLPALASRLTNRATDLMKLGRADEAFPSFAEAAAIRRKLSRYRPAIFLPDLANTLRGVREYFRSTQKMREMEEIDAELVSIYRILTQIDSETHSEALALALHDQSLHLAHAGRVEDAIKAEEERIAIYRKLAKASPLPFRSKLADVLNDFSDDLRKWNRLDAAVFTAMESVELFRALAETAEEYIQRRVLPLENLFLALERLDGHEEDQERVLRELENVHAQLASKNLAKPDGKRGWALQAQAEFLRRLSRHEEAVVAYQKVLEVARELSPSQQQKRVLAALLNDLAVSATLAGQHDKGLPAIRESVEILRALSTETPGQHELELGLGLNSLAAIFHSRKEWVPAFDARTEGLQYLAAVLAVNPDPDALAFLPSYLETYRQEAAEAGASVDEALLSKLGAHLKHRKD